MMNTSVLTQLENNINQLSLDEQLWLMERLAHRIRMKTVAESAPVYNLAEMAADVEIQIELQRIEDEFSFAETDGLDMT